METIRKVLRLGRLTVESTRNAGSANVLLEGHHSVAGVSDFSFTWILTAGSFLDELAEEATSEGSIDLDALARQLLDGVKEIPSWLSSMAVPAIVAAVESKMDALVENGVEALDDLIAEIGERLGFELARADGELLGFQQRVHEEVRDLDGKRERLATFLATSPDIPKDEITRMNRQHGAMNEYSIVLHDRISAFV